MVDVVLLRMELVVISLMVSVGLFRLELRSVNVGWQWWLSFVMMDVLLLWVVSDGLFKLALLVSLMEVGLLIGVALLIRAFAGGWLLEGALMSVFVLRLRMYCMMLVDGFCWFAGLGWRFVCVAVGRWLWRSLMVEGLWCSLVFGVGLFKVALWRSLVVDVWLGDGVWWCMLVSGRFVGALLVLDVALLVLMMPLIGGLLGDWRWDVLLEDGWGVVVLMVGKYISMVVCDRRRRDLLVRAG